MLRNTICFVVCCAPLASAQQYVYWADTAGGPPPRYNLQRGTLDGNGAPEIIFDMSDGTISPVDVEFDPIGQRIYWSEAGGAGIRRGDKDGLGTIEDLFSSLDGIVEPRGVALDIPNGFVYWTDIVGKKIQRGNSNGMGLVEDLYTAADGVSEPQFTDLDTQSGFIYWTDNDIQKVQRAPMDGTGPVEDLFVASDGLIQPMGIVLDLSTDTVYWTDCQLNTIVRGNMDGTGTAETVVTFPENTCPLDMELDEISRFLYWFNGGTYTIVRAPIDYLDAVHVLYSPTDGIGAGSPFGIALDSEGSQPLGDNSLLQFLISTVFVCIIASRHVATMYVAG